MEAEAKKVNAVAPPKASPPPPVPTEAQVTARAAFLNQSDAPPCPSCGSITVRNGACYKCFNCGATTGCS